MAWFQPLLAQDPGDSTLVNTGGKDSLSIPYRKLHKASFDSEVTYSAEDSIRIMVRDKLIILYGNAEVHYKDLKITASRISINFETNVMVATPYYDSLGKRIGTPHFEDSKDAMDADSFHYSFKSKKGIIYGLITEVADGLMTGEKVKKDEENNMYIHNARYSTCTDTAHPHFYIQTRKMKLIPNKKIVSGPAIIYVADVPTPAALPFGYFPITKGRQSGIVVPKYGYSPNRGYFLRDGGYYFGISDRFDLALTGDVYANLSWRAQATTYYAKRYKYSGNLSLNYAVNKDNEREDLDYSEGRDFLFNWTHVMDNRARPKTNFSANVQLGTSNYLRINSYNPNDMVTNTMNSGINFSRTFGFGSLTAAARHNQNTNTGSVNVTLPDVNFDVFRFYPFRGKNYSGSRSKWYQDIGVTYSSSIRNQLNIGDSNFTMPVILEAMQYGMQHRAAAVGNFKVFKHFAFNPSVSYNEYWYFHSIHKVFERSEGLVRVDTNAGFARAFEYNYSAGLSTKIYGMYLFRNGRVKAVRHVFTPRVALTYRPDFGQEKYGYYRKVQVDSAGNEVEYSIFERGIFGGPGNGRQGMLDLNLENNLEMKVRDDKDTATGTRKVKLLEVFNIATRYNLLADSNHLQPIVIDLRTTLFKFIGIQFSSSLTAYGYEDSLGRMNREWLHSQRGKYVRLLSSRVYITTSFNSETLKGKAGPSRMRPYMHPYMTSQELLYLNSPDQFVDFNIPWNFNLSYVYTHSRPTAFTLSEIQTVNVSGDFSLTPKWKIGFNTGVDITQKQMSMTTFNLYRDLHCWEFRLDWMPFGDRRYFAFTMNAKSSVLQDLKLNRRRDWFDR